MWITNAYAQSAGPLSGGSGSLMGLLPFLILFVALYFITIRPQVKRQKEHKTMIEALAKGDEVVVAGGVLGRVTRLDETYLTVEVAQGVELQVQRSAVLQVLPKGSFKTT